MKLNQSIWSYRGFIIGSVKREFQSKYNNSLLGVLWIILQPLSMIFVYTLIFSRVMNAKLPEIGNSYSYGIYLCSGIIAWGLFSEIITRSINVFISNSNLLKKINFPKICLPLIVILSALLNFLIIFSLLVVFLLAFGYFPGIVILAVAPLLLITILLSSGIGIFFGVLNVFYRDVGQFFLIFLQLWFWLTPVGYK